MIRAEAMGTLTFGSAKASFQGSLIWVNPPPDVEFEESGGIWRD